MSATPNQNSGIVSFGAGAALPHAVSDDEQMFASALATISARIPSPVLMWAEHHVHEKIRDEATVSFVRGLVLATEPLNEYSASLIAIATSGLVAWAHLSEGLPLRRSVLLNPQVTDMYLGHLLASGRASGTVRNYRKYLERAATAVGVIASGDLASVPGKTVTAPYSPAEEQRFGVWARTLKGELGAARALALLGLVAGAGLRNDEALRVRVRDVVDESGMWIRVTGGADRLTPVRSQWAPYVRHSIKDLSPDEFVFPHGDTQSQQLIQEWLGTLDRRTRLVPGRLRATWIVAQLNDAAPPESLLAWAGIARGETISHYLPFVPDATEQLRRTYMHLRCPIGGFAAS